MQNQCAEIKIRAERRAGEIIPEQIRRPEEGRPKKGYHDDTLKLPLKDLGVTKLQSSRWQEIASIPEQVEHGGDRKSESRSQEEIAEAVGIPRQTITDYAESFQKQVSAESTFSESAHKPPTYNVWRG